MKQALAQPLTPVGQDLLRTFNHATLYQAGELLLDADAPGLTTQQRQLARQAQQTVREARMAGCPTLARGDQQEARLFARLARQMAPGQPSALPPALEAELSKLTGQVLDRSREKARANWLEADLQVRRWIGSSQNLSEARILELAKILSKGLFNNGQSGGQYRTKIQYYRSGTRYTLLPLLPEKIRDELKQFVAWHNKQGRALSPIDLAARDYAYLASMQALPDGNNRLAEHVANWTLQAAGLPPATFTDVPRSLTGSRQDPKPRELAVDVAVYAVTTGIGNTLGILARTFRASETPPAN